MGKDLKNFILELSNAIRQKALPLYGDLKARQITGKAIGGDSTFLLDDISETFLHDYLENEKMDIAYYSEDRGLVEFGKPEKLLIVDPIDGTRAAAAGLESSCISIAVAEYSDDPRMKDITIGCVQEIKNGRTFVAEKDGGISIYHRGKELSSNISTNTDIRSLFWSMGLRGKPTIPAVMVLEELINVSNFNGTVFALGSASFSLTRIATGQLDSYVDIGHRLVMDYPSLEKEYIKVGHGSIVNNYPYDIAAGYLIVKEAGGFVTDAYGRDLDERPLMGIGKDFQLSTVASANSELQSIILLMIDKGFNKLNNNLSEL